MIIMHFTKDLVKGYHGNSWYGEGSISVVTDKLPLPDTPSPPYSSERTDRGFRAYRSSITNATGYTSKSAGDIIRFLNSSNLLLL